MNRAFFEAVYGPHGAVLLDGTDERNLRALCGDFSTYHHDGQFPPDVDWRTWLLMAGRGFGKTRAGAEWVLSLVRGATNPPRPLRLCSGGEVAVRGTDEGGPKSGAVRAAGPLHHPSGGSPPRAGEDFSNIHIALVAATVDEARSIMVEGPSGLLALAGENEIAAWSPSLGTLHFASGAVATLYSGARGESLRGPQHSHAWCDELAKWAQAENAWNNCSSACAWAPIRRRW